MLISIVKSSIKSYILIPKLRIFPKINLSCLNRNILHNLMIISHNKLILDNPNLNIEVLSEILNINQANAVHVNHHHLNFKNHKIIVAYKYLLFYHCNSTKNCSK